MMISPEALTFKDLFFCKVCSRNCLQSSVALSCGHIICKDCFKLEHPLPDQNKTYAPDDDRTGQLGVICPVCNCITTEDSIYTISRDVFLNLNLGSEVEPDKSNLDPESTDLSVSGRSQCSRTTADLVCAICSLDGSAQAVPAVYQCLDCLDLLCDECSSIHQKTRYTRTHVVSRISELTAGSKEGERKKRSRLPCERHPDKVQELYCVPCGKMICLQCKLIDHNTHICSDLHPAAKGRRGKIATDQIIVNERLALVQRLLKQCRGTTAVATSEREQLNQRLTERMDFLKHQLDVYCNHLTSQINEHYQQFVTLNQQRDEELLAHASNLFSFKLLSERLLNSATDVQILACKLPHFKKFEKYTCQTSLPILPQLESLNLNIPHTTDSAVGMLLGHVVAADVHSKGDELKAPHKLTQQERLGGAHGRYFNDDGKLPHLSDSGRIYEAYNEMNNIHSIEPTDAAHGLPTAPLGRPVERTDFKKCVLYRGRRDTTAVKLATTNLVIDKPSTVFTSKNLPPNASVVKLAAMSNSDLVVAVFYRFNDFSQTRHCHRVRLQIYGLRGEMKMDMAYGALIYGLAVGKQDQIIVSGGQIRENTIDIIWKDKQKMTSFTPRCQPGGIAIDNFDNIVIAGPKTVEYYTMEGKFIKSFDDKVDKAENKYGGKGFELIRKDLVISLDEDIFVSDANTNSVRGYSSHGDLLFTYGHYISHTTPILNPRGISVDELGHVLVCDMLTSSIHILSNTGAFQCKILEGEIKEPRDIVCFNSCYIAIGQNYGKLQTYQYMYDKDRKQSV